MTSKIEDTRTAFQIEDSARMFSQSFNRMVYFLPLSENLNFSAFPDEWSIISEKGLRQVVDPPKDEQDSLAVLNGFKHFTYLYLLRDCIESFALSLDDLYATLVLNNKNPDRVSNIDFTDEEVKQVKKFGHAGLYRRRDGKLQLLAKDFNLKINNEHRKVISSLKDIRDCLSHSGGVVTPDHGIKTSKFTEREFSWFYYALNKRDKKVVLKPNSKNFNVGEQLIFSPYEILEIAHSLRIILTQYIVDAADLIKS